MEPEVSMFGSSLNFQALGGISRMAWWYFGWHGEDLLSLGGNET